MSVPSLRMTDLRRLGAITATLLVVANMIGTGVFTTTGFLIRDLQSAPAVLLGWLVGGLLALCGALCYAELVAALPRNGGEYQLLGRIYHPAAGFVAGWISLVVGFSAPIAAAAIAFGRYLAALLPGVPPMVAALVLIAALSTLHALHVVAGGRVQNVFTALKLLLILVFAVGGLIVGDAGQALAAGARPLGETALSPEFAIGLIFIAFAYSGWNGAAYLASEVRRPGRTLPLALIVGTLIVAALYLALNWAFLASAPASELAGKVEVGHVAATRLFGEGAGSLVSGLVALALVSSVSAMIMAGPRVYHAMGEDHPRLGWLNNRTRHGGPAAAVVLQAVIAAIMVVSMTFETLLTYIGFTLSISAGLTALGVIKLKLAEPDLERPYRTPGYPLTPLLFAALCAWMAGHALIQAPVVGLTGLITIAVGLLLYWLVKR